MVTLISPAKTLDFETPHPQVVPTVPEDISESAKINRKLRSLSKKKIAGLMDISPELAALNHDRYQNWTEDFSTENSSPCIFAFNGEVYRGLNSRSFSEKELAFAQKHLRILSGLHGLLRPLDLVQPYRLEMGTSLPVLRKKNLYDFWQKRVTARINADMKAAGTDFLVNLASAEYFKVIDQKKITGRIITPVFKDFKGGEYKVVMTWAKIARGAMAAYIIKNGIIDPEELKGFREYMYNDRLSTESEWVFTRED